MIEVANELHAQLNDEVVVEISASTGLAAFFFLFGLPIILALIGVLIGNRFREFISIVLGIIGLALGLVIAKVINNRLSQNPKFLPKIVGILEREGS